MHYEIYTTRVYIWIKDTTKYKRKFKKLKNNNYNGEKGRKLISPMSLSCFTWSI